MTNVLKTNKQILYEIAADDWISNELARVSSAIKTEFSMLAENERDLMTFKRMYEEILPQYGYQTNLRKIGELYAEEGEKAWYIKEKYGDLGKEKLSDLIDDESRVVLEQADTMLEGMNAMIKKNLENDKLNLDAVYTKMKKYTDEQLSFCRSELDKITNETDETRAERDERVTKEWLSTEEQKATLERMNLDKS